MLLVKKIKALRRHQKVWSKSRWLNAKVVSCSLNPLFVLPTQTLWEIFSDASECRGSKQYAEYESNIEQCTMYGYCARILKQNLQIYFVLWQSIWQIHLQGSVTCPAPCVSGWNMRLSKNRKHNEPNKLTCASQWRNTEMVPSDIKAVWSPVSTRGTKQGF